MKTIGIDIAIEIELAKKLTLVLPLILANKNIDIGIAIAIAMFKELALVLPLLLT